MSERTPVGEMSERTPVGYKSEQPGKTPRRIASGTLAWQEPAGESSVMTIQPTVGQQVVEQISDRFGLSFRPELRFRSAEPSPGQKIVDRLEGYEPAGESSRTDSHELQAGTKKPRKKQAKAAQCEAMRKRNADGEGFEETTFSSGNSNGLPKSGAESGAVDSELARVADQIRTAFTPEEIAQLIELLEGGAE
ncbi:MAG: hypothetical protein R3C28_04400 [Pirellulaceae bacterium]